MRDRLTPGKNTSVKHLHPSAEPAVAQELALQQCDTAAGVLLLLASCHAPQDHCNLPMGFCGSDLVI